MYRLRKAICVLLAGLCLVFGGTPLIACAAQCIETTGVAEVRATNDFSVMIPAGEAKSMNTLLPLSSGDSVTICAYYSPKNVTVNFGLISPDGIFHYVSCSNGHTEVSIFVDEPGNYRFAIQNPSSVAITASGQVQY